MKAVFVKLIKVSLSFLYVVVLSGASFDTQAQMAGDYRSAVASGNWSSTASWQFYNGTSWATPSITQGYPGQFAAASGIVQTGTVTIQNSHTITLDVSPAQPVGALVVGGGTSGTLNASGNRSLTVTNDLTVNSGASVSYLGTSSLTTNNLILNASSTFAFGGTSTLTINGNFLIGSGVTFTFSGTSNLILAGGISTSSNFTYSGTTSLIINGDFTVNPGASFTCSTTGNLTVNGITTIAGAFVDNENTGTTTFNYPVTVTGTWTSTVITQEIRMVFNANVTNSGTFNAGGIQIGSNGTITANALMTISSGIDTNDNLTIAGTNTVAVTGDESNIGTVSTGNLTVNSTLNLSGTAGAGVLDITGNLIVNGTLVFSSATQGNADIRGTTTINGSFSDTQNNGVDTFYGQVTVSTGGSWTTTAVTTAANLVFQNGISHSGTTFSAGAATFNTNGQAIQGSSTLSFGNAVTVTGVTLTNNGTVSMTNTGAGILSGTGTFTQGTNSTLNYAGSTILVTNFNASASGNKVNYNAAAQTIMNSVSSRYYHLTLAGSGTKVISAATDIDGNVSIEGTAVFSVNTSNITVGGNWSVTSTNADPFTEGTRTVTLDGSTDQSITGSTAFYNLAISKSAGNVILNGTATTTVSNILTLSTRHIISSSTHLLALGSAATLSGGSASSFVSGPMRKVIAASGTFSFPLGSVSVNRYRPAVLGNTNGSDTWTVQYFGYSPSTDGYSNTSLNAVTIGGVSGFEYWEVSRLSTTRADVTLSYNTGSYNASSIGTVSNLRVVHWGPTQWDMPSGGGVSSQTGTTTAGTVKITNVTSFSPFTIGTLDVNSPLPVTWMSFTGESTNNVVTLTWKTASERNNDHFEIERSNDGMDFLSVGKLPGKGNTNVPQHYQFTDRGLLMSKYYYRLRQVDFDGNFDYSKTITVDVQKDAEQHWVAFPNPMGKGGKFQLHPASSVDDKPVEVTLTSASGQVIFSSKGMLEQINDMLENTVEDILPGVYTVKILEGDYREQFNVIRQ